MDEKKKYIHFSTENKAVPEVSIEEAVEEKNEKIDETDLKNNPSEYTTEIDYSGAVPVVRFVKKEKKNVLVLTGSPRKGSNTDILVDEFKKGALEHGHNVTVISINDVIVNPCIGCNACFNDGNKCAQKDDMESIYNEMMNADTLVIASPLYFFGISAQLKAVIDRLHNPIRDKFKIKKIGLILVGGSKNPGIFDGVLKSYDSCVKYFHLTDIGHVLVNDTREKKDILNNEKALEKAYKLGLLA